MSAPFDAVYVIYNPNSTGSGKDMAQDLKKRLRRLNILATITPTEYAGHAKELAYAYAHKYKRPLIISASGDGGYHEVVNGVLAARAEGAMAVTGLLPAGNANDHHTAVAESSEIADSIAKGKTFAIDVLELTADYNGEHTQRYAHSYIGFGVTAEAAARLTEAQLNKFNELWIVFKSLLKIKPVYTLEDNKRRNYGSLIFSNIDRMSKHVTFTPNASVRDGKFEITKVPNKSPVRLLNLVGRALHRNKSIASIQTSKYTFTLRKATYVQLDGEVIKLPAASEVTVISRKHLLECVI